VAHADPACNSISRRTGQAHRSHPQLEETGVIFAIAFFALGYLTRWLIDGIGRDAQRYRAEIITRQNMIRRMYAERN